jgi:hypothetical protein
VLGKTESKYGVRDDISVGEMEFLRFNVGEFKVFRLCVLAVKTPQASDFKSITVK